jgi:hypothetical protein
MAKASGWSGKVLALVQGGNTSAAIAQIKVAPSVKDLKQLEAALSAFGGRWPDIDQAVADNISALSAPRLHRSP